MFEIDSIAPAGQPPYYTGLVVSGTAPAAQTVSVYYEIPASGTKSAPLSVQAGGDGAWTARFNGEFDAGATVEAHAECDGAKQTATATLPRESQ